MPEFNHMKNQSEQMYHPFDVIISVSSVHDKRGIEMVLFSYFTTTIYYSVFSTVDQHINLIFSSSAV